MKILGKIFPKNSDDIPDVLDAPQTAVSSDTSAAEESHLTKRSQKIRVQTDVLDIIINTRGGDVRQVDLPTYPVSLQKQDEAFRLMRSDAITYIAQSGLRHDKVNGQTIVGKAPTHHEIYNTEKNEYQLADGQDELSVKLTWKSGNGIEVEKIYTFMRSSFVYDITHRVINRSDSTYG